MKYKKGNKILIRLQERTAPYCEFWFEWIHSPCCYLSKKEVDAILLYQHYQNFEIVGKIMGYKPGSVYLLLNKALSRLLHRSCERQYKDWMAESILEDAGAYDHYTPIETFLSTPIRAFNLPSPLSNALRNVGETMGEVLEKWGEKDLLQMNNFGPKKLDQLKKFLKANNALKALRKKVREDSHWK